uniref:CUB domain-containing protein n=1 Tax=Rhodnius prolixus TaxID=13249 RepID=T1HA30_RHOPR
MASLAKVTDSKGEGCECLVYSSTFGKEYGRFTSPDFPKPYPPNIDCLLYTFIAGSQEIIEIALTDFNIYKANKDAGCVRLFPDAGVPTLTKKVG